MAALETVASIAAVVSALADVYSIGQDTFERYLERRRQQITPQTVPQYMIFMFGTYSDEEVEKIEERLLNCRKNFVAEGSGSDRWNCLCNVLKHVDKGNNGLPPGPWSDLAKKLGCAVSFS